MPAAPITPPMSAWLLELGIPTRHVMRFQVMAPTSAPTAVITYNIGLAVPLIGALSTRIAIHGF